MTIQELIDELKRCIDEEGFDSDALVLIDVIDDGGLAHQTPNTLVDFYSSCKQLLSINAHVEDNSTSEYQKLEWLHSQISELKNGFTVDLDRMHSFIEDLREKHLEEVSNGI